MSEPEAQVSQSGLPMDAPVEFGECYQGENEYYQAPEMQAQRWIQMSADGRAASSPMDLGMTYLSGDDVDRPTDSTWTK